MLTFTQKTEKSDKMSDSFYTSAHTYLENELPKILNTTKDITLTPLSGGIMGTTYQLVHPETGNKLVVKLEDFNQVHYSAHLANQICLENNIPYPKLLHFDTPEYQEEKLTVQILEKIELPVYKDYLEEQPEDLNGIKHLGETVRRIHQKQTEGFGLLEDKTFIGPYKRAVDDLKAYNMKKEYLDFYIQNDLLTETELVRLHEILDDPVPLQNVIPVFCHGDIETTNCFYNPQDQTVMLFDYSAKSMPAELDLAIYKHKAQSKGHPERWELFKAGYGPENMNEELVDLIMTYLIFRKVTVWSQRGSEKRAKWGLEFIKRVLA